MPKPATKCETCGGGFEQRKGGRPAKFCSDTCRNRAHRQQSKPIPPESKPLPSIKSDAKPKSQLEYLTTLRDRLMVAIDEAPPEKIGPIAQQLRFTLKEIDALTPEGEEPSAPTRGGRPIRAFNPAAI